MICRIRSRAGVYLSALLLLAGVALTAKATQPVTRSQMESFVYVTIAGAAVAVFASFWVLLSSLVGRVERSLGGHVERLEQAVKDAFTAMHEHNNDALAHTAASEHNHGPMIEQTQRIEEKLDALILEHRIIRGSEGEVCMLVRSLAEKRSPMESPNISRKTDANGLDHGPERGPK